MCCTTLRVTLTVWKAAANKKLAKHVNKQVDALDSAAYAMDITSKTSKDQNFIVQQLKHRLDKSRKEMEEHKAHIEHMQGIIEMNDATMKAIVEANDSMRKSDLRDLKAAVVYSRSARTCGVLS